MGELSQTHLSYSGPEFHLDKITEELQEQAQVFREERIMHLCPFNSSLDVESLTSCPLPQARMPRRLSVTPLQTSSINSIFANLMNVRGCSHMMSVTNDGAPDTPSLAPL